LIKPRTATWKSVTLTFVVAVIFYLISYSCMHRWQTDRGPWQAAFAAGSDGVPQIIIGQPVLGFSNIVIRFEGEVLGASNSPGLVFFAKPKQPVPFGEVLYDDLMRQPGDVALDCFGHVVEMVPSALGLNSQRLGWTNNMTYSLWPTNKLSAAARAKFKGGYRR
jgi:hypothetical protein